MENTLAGLKPDSVAPCNGPDSFTGEDLPTGARSSPSLLVRQAGSDAKQHDAEPKETRLHNADETSARAAITKQYLPIHVHCACFLLSSVFWQLSEYGKAAPVFCPLQLRLA